MDEDAPLDAAGFKAKVGATDVQMADLESYRSMLADWNTRINLVGPSALQAFWPRHAWDSAQLQALAPQKTVWADIGAGAGFPGVVLGILMKQSPGTKIHLIESMAKRCRFLSEIVERLGLRAEIHNIRAEEIKLNGVEVVTARACAPMVRLLEFSWPLLSQGAFGLFLKGQNLNAELTEARKVWAFKASVSQSRSDASGAIVKIEGLSRV
jgi:16S rRNA (guanine527-N7)-methyltransferase